MGAGDRGVLDGLEEQAAKMVEMEDRMLHAIGFADEPSFDFSPAIKEQMTLDPSALRRRGRRARKAVASSPPVNGYQYKTDKLPSSSRWKLDTYVRSSDGQVRSTRYQNREMLARETMRSLKIETGKGRRQACSRAQLFGAGASNSSADSLGSPSSKRFASTYAGEAHISRRLQGRSGQGGQQKAGSWTAQVFSRWQQLFQVAAANSASAHHVSTVADSWHATWAPPQDVFTLMGRISSPLQTRARFVEIWTSYYNLPPAAVAKRLGRLFDSFDKTPERVVDIREAICAMSVLDAIAVNGSIDSVALLGRHFDLFRHGKQFVSVDTTIRLVMVAAITDDERRHTGEVLTGHLITHARARGLTGYKNVSRTLFLRLLKLMPKQAAATSHLAQEFGQNANTLADIISKQMLRRQADQKKHETTKAQTAGGASDDANMGNWSNLLAFADTPQEDSYAQALLDGAEQQRQDEAMAAALEAQEEQDRIMEEERARQAEVAANVLRRGGDEQLSAVYAHKIERAKMIYIHEQHDEEEGL
jgi:hypothetical protein